MEYLKWDIDMTKALIIGFGWIYIVITLDLYTKKIVGSYMWAALYI